MRKIRPMTSKRAVLTTMVSALFIAGVLAGCGDDSDPAPSTGTTVTESPTSQPADTGSKKDDNRPASAGDSSDGAPDNVISDRPGGARDQDKSGKKKAGEGGVSDDTDVEGPPVSPDPQK